MPIKNFFSRALLYACLGYILGIALHYIFSFSDVFIALFFAAFFFAVSFFAKRETRTAAMCACVLFLFCSLGIWYGALRMNTQFDNSHVGFYSSAKGTKATLEGIVARAPQDSLKNTKAVVDVRTLTLASGGSYAVQGLAEAFLPPHLPTGQAGAAIQENQEVEIAGVLQKPENFSGFDYQSYLGAQGIEATLMRASIQKAQAPASAPLARALPAQLSALRLYAKNLVAHFVPGPEGEIVKATTLGYGNELSQSLDGTLSRAGVRYLMAISGLHVIIIANMLIAFFLLWGFHRRMALCAAFIIIFLFGAFIAFPLPAVRAILMAGVFYIGQLIGRPLNIFRTLLYAATAMLAINPLLFADVGFQLSFMGLLGILLLAPFFEEQMRSLFVGKKLLRDENSLRARMYEALKKRSVWGLLAMSAAATLFTFPLALYHFGVTSLWGIFMSAWAVPLLGPLFILVCALIIFATISSGLGAIAAFPLWAGTHIFLRIAQFFSSQPFLIISTDAYNGMFLMFGYGLVALVLFFTARQGYDPLRASIRFFHFDGSLL